MEPQSNLSNPIEPKLNPTNKTHRILLITIIILLTAAVIGGGIYYVLNQQIKKQNELITELEKSNKKIEDKKEAVKTEEKKVEVKDETVDWKTYTNSKYGFSLKYPKEWSIEENVKSLTDGSSYVGMNIFSNENIVIKNDKKKYAISININDVFGRGGTCTRRGIRYKSDITSKKVTMTKETDSYELKASIGDMCGGIELKGYTATAGTLKYEGNEYYFHSENASLSDDSSNEAIEYFKKIVETITFN